MTPLETQLAELERLGLALRQGVGVPELLHSFDREVYESEPYAALLARMGGVLEVEPFDRRVSEDVWTIELDGARALSFYEQTCRAFAAMAGHGLDYARIDAGPGLAYRPAGRNDAVWDIDVDGDRVDLMVVSYTAGDLETPDRRFAVWQNGAQMVFVCCDAVTLVGLNRLSSAVSFRSYLPAPERPAWEPGDIATRADFEAWLARMDDALAALRSFVPDSIAEKLDGSFESLDALEAWLLQRYPVFEDVREPGERPVFDLAGRYAGETYIRHRGGGWRVELDDSSNVSYRTPSLTSADGHPWVCPYYCCTALVDRRTGSYLSGLLRARL